MTLACLSIGTRSTWCHIWWACWRLDCRPLGQKVWTDVLWCSLPHWLPYPQLRPLCTNCHRFQHSSSDWTLLSWIWNGLGSSCLPCKCFVFVCMLQPGEANHNEHSTWFACMCEILSVTITPYFSRCILVNSVPQNSEEYMVQCFLCLLQLEFS